MKRDLAVQDGSRQERNSTTEGNKVIIRHGNWNDKLLLTTVTTIRSTERGLLLEQFWTQMYQRE
jgi:hypothetical protein